MVPPLVTARRWAPARPAHHVVRPGPTRRGAAARRTRRRGSGPTSRSSTRAEDLVAQLGVGRRPPHQRGQLGDRPVVEGGHGHDLLGQHVERVARVAGGLDEPLVHAADDDRRLEQVGAVLGEELAPAGLAHLVAGPADALQPTRHRARRLDLDDQVDRAHVDAELERAGGHQALELAPLELVLDLQPLLARQRAVVGLDDVVPGRVPGGLVAAVLALEGQLVEAGGQPLGQAAGVHEDQRGAVLLDQLEQAGVDGRPDAAAHRAGRGRPAGRLVDDLAQRAHVVDRDHHLDLERLAHPGVDDGHRPRLETPFGSRGEAAEEAGDLLERAAGWPTARCAAADDRTAARGARARGPGGRPAWWGPAAWISSTMTASTPRSVSRLAEVSMR